MAFLLLAGCTRPLHGADPTAPPTLPAPTATATSTPTPAIRPTSTTIPATATPTLTPTLTPTPPVWQTLRAGVSQTYLAAPTPGTEALSYVYALRIDPAQMVFQVHYDRREPHMVDEWQALTRAPILFNGGFFSGEGTPVGRIISDGTLYGAPLNYGERTIGVAGLFTVLEDEVQIHVLGRGNYNPRGMRFDQAVESYPILLLPGGQPTYLTETGERARRTVIALDTQGRVVVLLSDLPIFSLYELSHWLAASGLNLEVALNLDGGRSSGLIATLPGGGVFIPSYVPLPVVIAAYPRHEQ